MVGLPINREAIYSALFDTLRAIRDDSGRPIFKETSRRWKSAWDDPGARVPMCPMLIQWEQVENYTWTSRGAGALRSFTIKLEIYAKIPGAGQGATGSLSSMQSAPGVPNKTTPGSTVLNPLIDAIDNALSAAADSETGRLTLGGLVFDCRIEGTLIKVLGDEDPSGLCGGLVPVVIMIP